MSRDAAAAIYYEEEWVDDRKEEVKRSEEWMASSNAEREFYRLCAWWELDTRSEPSIAKIIAHPAYREIVALGRAVLPLILVQFQVRPNHWHTALSEITGADPVPADHAGDLAAMAKDWLKWAAENSGTF
ncbi:MAG TPA: hypothetical protein VMB50_04785 [Myxococcales bacterium]|nr:hypothetical protein [Myxococcales bacterium]